MQLCIGKFLVYVYIRVEITLISGKQVKIIICEESIISKR